MYRARRVRVRVRQIIEELCDPEIDSGSWYDWQGWWRLEALCCTAYRAAFGTNGKLDDPGVGRVGVVKPRVTREHAGTARRTIGSVASA